MMSHRGSSTQLASIRPLEKKKQSGGNSVSAVTVVSFDPESILQQSTQQPEKEQPQPKKKPQPKRKDSGTRLRITPQPVPTLSQQPIQQQQSPKKSEQTNTVTTIQPISTEPVNHEQPKKTVAASSETITATATKTETQVGSSSSESSMLDGEFDENASHQMFLDALMEWRNSNKPPSERKQSQPPSQDISTQNQSSGTTTTPLSQQEQQPYLLTSLSPWLHSLKKQQQPTTSYLDNLW